MSEWADPSLLLQAMLQWGGGWKRGKGRGGCCTTVTQGAPVHQGLRHHNHCTTLRVPCAPTGVSAAPHGGPCPPEDAQDPPAHIPSPNPGHLLSVSSACNRCSSYSAFSGCNKSLSLHTKAKSRREAWASIRATCQGPMSPVCNQGAAPQPAPLCRAHVPAAKVFLAHGFQGDEAPKRVPGSSTLDADGKATSVVGMRA